MALTFQDIDNMPSDEYKQKLQNDPSFVKEVEALFKGPQPTSTDVSVSVPEDGIDPSLPDRSIKVTTSASVRDRLESVASIAPTVSVAPVLPVVPVAPLPELTYEYQPMDDHNRPMGGKQVIKYHTQEELTQKLVEQNTLILRQLRKVTRDSRLGISQDNIPNDAARFEGIVELKPKELSADERFQLVQDLNDPEKFAPARDRLLESAVGVPPAQLRQILNDQQMTILQLRAKENFLSFSEQHSFMTGDITTDKENAQTLTDWMFKNKLAPTVENFNLACSQLRSAGLLNEAPVVQRVPEPAPAVPVEIVVPKAQEPVVTESRIAPVESVQPKRHSQVPSGLNDRVSSASGVPSVNGNSLTLADIDKMSADAYKKAMKDPAFKNLVNRLENEAIIKRQQRVNA